MISLNMESYLTLVITLIGSLGGVEAIKYVVNLKTNKQRELLGVSEKQLEVLESQLTILRGQIDWLEAALKEKNARLDTVYDEQMASEKRLLDLHAAKSVLEIELERLRYWRCNRAKCRERVPPQPGVSFEDETGGAS